jgi:Carbohydrate family 9 binding domain-like
MPNALVSARAALRLAVIATTLLALTSSARASARAIAFRCDGKDQEKRFLWKQDSRSYVLEGWARPVRNLDGEGRYAIWRFDTSEATAAQFRVELLNSFALSVSKDGEAFEELAREEASGGSNLGWKKADLTPFLPSDWLYVKLAHGAPEKWNGGFGACVFQVRLEMTDDRDVAVAIAARTPAPVKVDGVLDDPAWQTAQPLATLTDRFLTRPVGRDATFRLCYDETHWYVSARCAQPGAKEVIVAAKDHDSATYSEDAVEIFLQPPGQEDYFHLAINMAGVVFDQRNGEGAASWDAHAETAVVCSTAEWTIEASIPLEDMGIDAMAPGQDWRVGLYRDDMGFAQYAAWSSVADGGWHQKDRFGKMRLAPLAEAGLPSVNVAPSLRPVLGDNTVALALHGQVNPAAHRLTLAVLPQQASRLPEEDQDLKRMNPVSQTVPWPEPLGTTVEAAYPLDRIGAAHLVATLSDTGSGQVLSRAVSSAVLTLGEVMPLQLTLQQPFISTEEELPVELVVNRALDEMEGATVHLAVVDEAGAVVHAEPPRAAERHVHAVLPAASLALGSYTVRAEVVAASGETLASAEGPLTKHEPFGEPTRVRIGTDGLCYVNGEPRMPLGFMLAPPDKAIADAGYDIALYGGETLEGRNQMDTAAANRVLVMPHICNYLRGKSDFDAIRAVVSLRKTEPALFAWYLADEPEGYGDTPDVLREAYKIIKSIDPHHPVVVLTNAPGMLHRYEGCADIIIADPYPVPAHPLTMVAEWTDTCVAAAKAHSQAPWMTPQGFGWSDIGASDAPSPTREELTNMLYTCFIHGAKGILWWPYNTPRKNYWPHFIKMGRESRFFEPWILHGEDAGGMPAGVQVTGDVHWRAWQHEGRTLILAANLARQSRSVEIPLGPDVHKVSCPFDQDLEALVASHAEGGLSLVLAPVQTVTLVLE